MNKNCAVCGSNDFAHVEVLWQELIDDWELSPIEVSYINRQQGSHCVVCGNNLRSIALASAIINSYHFHGTLAQFVLSDLAKSLRVLEINEAGGLSSTLSFLPSHILVRYPEFDMTKLTFDSSSFDLVLHSDTLEHVSDPVAGLSECRRVLQANGRCIYTVPLIVRRLSRSRKGLKKSYHGNVKEIESDYIVHTEFGADAWKFAVEAGFICVRIHSFEYPSALAIEATL